ncbi:RDD family protein [Phyllobacterium sp. 21LDTY02-6]|uniref:RDD family protein n=1 Tax=Phyllobacterium sp. 21LDTY02-6 TaxID=2944903 RepID=UPI002022187B|nr:RDD family protein [Phyllobacterium sp. 21LDTY02-6]MCO4319682.1 RDD family protein [Phyllobacterium sp. 21LDTY02-6]
MNAKTLDGEIIADRFDDRRLYQGVLTSRIFAFIIDYAIVFLLCIPVAILIAILGVATLGLGWMLYGVMFPLVALAYVATTLGGPRQATKGMQIMGLRLERLNGQKVDGLLAIVHTVLFWGLNVVLTPLILLATLFLDRKRTLHDLLLGTVVVRAYQ